MPWWESSAVGRVTSSDKLRLGNLQWICKVASRSGRLAWEVLESVFKSALQKQQAIWNGRARRDYREQGVSQDKQPGDFCRWQAPKGGLQGLSSQLLLWWHWKSLWGLFCACSAIAVGCCVVAYCQGRNQKCSQMQAAAQTKTLRVLFSLPLLERLSCYLCHRRSAPGQGCKIAAVHYL